VMKILIVDDDNVDRELAQRCLRDIDELEVLLAENGDAAMEAMESTHPDVVLTDLRMPGISGLELVERLAEEHPLVPVILMTSQGNETLAVEALYAGAASYLPKSDLRYGLADAVEQMLSIVEARRSRSEVLRFLTTCETRFELINDPQLITPLAAFIEDGLGRFGFGSKPLRSQVGICLMEALANAMLHGNLAVDAKLRREDRDAFDRQISERREIEPYAARRVRCEAHESPGAVRYTISDEGAGFDVAALPDATDPGHLLEVGGRGIMLMRTIMDEVTFADGGATVTLVKNAPDGG